MNTEFNRHSRDLISDTLEFNVKQYNCNALLSESDWIFENETGDFTNNYGKQCFNEIKKAGYKWLNDWSFAGRSNGWFVLLVDCDPEKLRQSTINRLERIVEKFERNYDKRISEYYGY